MDPNAVLQGIRQLCEDLRNATISDNPSPLTVDAVNDKIDRLTREFSELDQWIRSGGTPPEDWMQFSFHSGGQIFKLS